MLQRTRWDAHCRPQPPRLPSSPQAGAGLSVPLGQKFQFGQDGLRDGDIGVPQQSLDLPVEVYAELEGHEERIRVEQDEPRHRFRPSMPTYLAVRWKSRRGI